MSEVAGIVRCFLDNKEFFETYYKYVVSLKNLEKEYKHLLQEIKQYYIKYEDKTSITLEEFEIYYYLNNPTHKGRELYINIFNTLNKSTLQESNRDLIIDILKSIMEQHYAAQLCEQLVPLLGGAGTKHLTTIIEPIMSAFTEDYAKLAGASTEESPFMEKGLDELFADEDSPGGLRWRLNFLNEYIGPIRGGVLGHIFARTDSGKTSFALSEATYFATQLTPDECMIYFCNEEGAERVKRRAVNALLGLSREHILKSMAQHGKEKVLRNMQRLWIERGGDKIRFFDGATHITQVQTILEHYAPKVCIIDQGAKVHIFEEDKLSGPGRLQALYEQYRSLAKKYNCPIVTLGQADAESEGRKWLGLTNMDGSKVGIPGELDFCVGVGRSYTPGEENTRFMNVCKNKLLNGLTGRGTIYFDREKSLFVDKGE